jgi:hypothetical protein
MTGTFSGAGRYAEGGASIKPVPVTFLHLEAHNF